MKPTRSNHFAIGASFFALASASTLSAADQTWNNSASSSIWSTSALNWTGAAWTDGNKAIFGATGAGAITVSGTVIVGTLSLTSASSGDYSFTGGTLQATPVATVPIDDRATGWTFNKGAAISSTIAATLTGSQNVNILTTTNSDAGKLTITGPVSMSGTGTGNFFRPNGRFLFKDNTVALTNVRLALGADSGATYGFENSTVTITGDSLPNANRGISTQGTLNVTNSTISTPYAQVGNGTGGTLNMTSGTLTTGLLEFTPGTTSTCTLNLNGGTIELTELKRGTTTGSTVNLNLNSGILKALANNTVFFNLTAGTTTNANVMAGGAKINSNGFDITIPLALISGVAGDGGLAKSGDGTLTLSAANSYLGTTTVSGGTLQLSGTTGSLTGTAGIINNANLTVSRTNDFTQTTDLNGKAITGSGSFTQAGAGTTTLSAANTYTGKTLINAGKLSVADESGLGSNPGISTADQLTFNGGTLLTTATLSIDDANRGITLGASGGTLEVSTGTTTTIATTNVIAGAGGLTKSGAGTLVLSGNNTYAGTTTTGGAGLLRVDHNNALGSTAGGTVINAVGGFAVTGLQLGNGVTVTDEPLTMATTGTSVSMLSVASGSGNSATWAGDINITGTGYAILHAQNGNLTINGDITRSTNGLFYLWGSGNGTLNGTVNLGTQDVRIDTGTWTLNSAVTWGNTALRLAASKLVLGVTDALPTSTVLLFGDLSTSSGGGTLALSGKNQTVAGLSNLTTTTGRIVNGSATAATLTVNNSTANTFDGVLGGTGTDENNFGLTKTGAGTLTLTGTNTYTGDTIVSAGTLKIDGGSVGSSDVTVNGGVLASGTTGTVGKIVTVNNGATFAAGGIGSIGSIGAASVTSNLNFSSGSIFDWDLTTGPGNGTYDTVSVTGNLNITSGAKFNVVSSTAFNDTFWNTAHTWSNIFGTKTIDNFLTTNFLYSGSSTAPASEGYFTVSGSNLSWTAVPEPTSASVGLLIGAGLLRRRRKA